MAARLADKKKKKIVADYLETQSINATAKKNNVSWGTVRSVLDGMGEIEEKLEQKKEQNTVDILAYGEQRNFRFKGEPTYTNEVYIKNVGEICFPCIVKRKARKNNKISIYDNFEQL